eukprot:5304979-Prymnesium_polylepis.2
MRLRGQPATQQRYHGLGQQLLPLLLIEWDRVPHKPTCHVHVCLHVHVVGHAPHQPAVGREEQRVLVGGSEEEPAMSLAHASQALAQCTQTQPKLLIHRVIHRVRNCIILSVAVASLPFGGHRWSRHLRFCPRARVAHGWNVHERLAQRYPTRLLRCATRHLNKCAAPLYVVAAHPPRFVAIQRPRKLGQQRRLRLLVE